LTLEEVEEVSGLSRHTLARLAAGGRPGEATAQVLADVLGVAVADVLEPAGWLARERRRRTPARQAWLDHAFSVPATGDPEWASAAVCRSADPEAFWPGKGSYPAAALALCARCPVLGDCRDDFEAAELRDPSGVWFGTTPAERAERRQLDQREEWVA